MIWPSGESPLKSDIYTPTSPDAGRSKAEVASIERFTGTLIGQEKENLAQGLNAGLAAAQAELKALRTD